MELKLSEAIRLGAMNKPQSYGTFYGKDLRVSRTAKFPWFRFEVVETSCALGAAYEAIGAGYREVTEPAGAAGSSFRGKPYVLKRPQVFQIYDTPYEWSRVFWIETPCPVCRRIEQIKRVIPHLNDKHRWSREQIADWVERIEKEMAPQSCFRVEQVSVLEQ